MKIIAHSSHPGLPDRITIEHNGTVLTSECKAVPSGTSDHIKISFDDEMFTFDSTPSPVAIGGWHAPYIDDEHRNAVEAPMISAARCSRVGTVLSPAADLGFAYELERCGERAGFTHPATPVNGAWVNMATIMETGLEVM